MSKSVRVDVAMDAGTNSCRLVEMAHSRRRLSSDTRQAALVPGSIRNSVCRRCSLTVHTVLVLGRTKEIDTTEAKHPEEQEG
jgi:hypothetical protein